MDTTPFLEVNIENLKEPQIEELKKFHPSLEVDEAEDMIETREMTDMLDILKVMLAQKNEQ